jgi:hypothetical protein
MGAGASVPDLLDEAAAKELAGGHWNQELFDAQKDEGGKITKAQFEEQRAAIKPADAEEKPDTTEGTGTNDTTEGTSVSEPVAENDEIPAASEGTPPATAASVSAPDIFELYRPQRHAEAVRRTFAADQLGMPPLFVPIPSQPPMREWFMPYVQRRAALQETGKIVLSSGRKMAYFIDCDDPPDGSPAPVDIIGIHGIGCGKEQWLQPTTPTGVRFIAFDRLGHGESDDEPEGYSYKEMANDFTELVNSLGINKFGLLGHGMGGAYALNFAAASGGRVLGVGIVAGVLLCMGSIPWAKHQLVLC